MVIITDFLLFQFTHLFIWLAFTEHLAHLDSGTQITGFLAAVLLILAARQNRLGSSEEIALPEPYSVPSHKESLIVVLKLGYVKLFRIFLWKKQTCKQKSKPKAQGARAKHMPMIAEKHLGGLVCPVSFNWSYIFLSCFIHLLRKHKSCFPTSSVLATKPDKE